MPSRMMHYCIGNEILKRVKLDTNLFTTGNLSPDAHDHSYYGVGASHFKNGYDPVKDKYPIVDLNAFKNKYLSKMYDDFVLGYYSHLITDNLWTESIYYKFLQVSEDERTIRVEKCYHDYYVLNNKLVERFNLAKSILHLPNHLLIDEITVANLNRIVEEFNGDFSHDYNDGILQIFTMNFIENFIRYAAEECIKEILGLKDEILKKGS